MASLQVRDFHVPDLQSFPQAAANVTYRSVALSQLRKRSVTPETPEMNARAAARQPPGQLAACPARGRIRALPS
ncbi:hypothetical protein AS9A_0352 [Hoyosella subflava DQS3-9A1]|uniref:Uncharacterized protein n=1 Tax=Hoyosella subflava (strain DSM 45089 / JCM 17490 / NBRC 109087 / DQS3-9A1) TaxID=443218 RepID=F6EGY7_HOYSD|nr:hypothetical protein AS9A_0352 [Hoyosella subflava DQS3-9A1]